MVRSIVVLALINACCGFQLQSGHKGIQIMQSRPSVHSHRSQRPRLVGASSPTTEIERVELRRFTLSLWRISVGAWWSQVILSSISGVTLFFANAALESASRGSAVTSGFSLSSVGLLFSFVSIFLTSLNCRTALKARSGKSGRGLSIQHCMPSILNS